MSFLDVLRRSSCVLCDGGLETRIAYETDIPLDPDMGVARLVDDDRGRPALESVYRGYLEVGRRHAFPMHVGTPTFRAGTEWLRRAGLAGSGELVRINREGFLLLARLRDSLGNYGANVFIAGVIGPRGDAYQPEEAPGEVEAHAYHRAQAVALAEAGVDLLYGPTFPSAPEVLGAARAMAELGLPYVLSPIIDRGGRLLDGSPLAEVIDRTDQAVSPGPAYFTVSCVHPGVLHDALRADERLRRLAGGRLLGIKANASDKPPRELVTLDHLDADPPGALADDVMALRTEFGLKVLGGCCGTGQQYIEALAGRLAIERR